MHKRWKTSKQNQHNNIQVVEAHQPGQSDTRAKWVVFLFEKLVSPPGWVRTHVLFLKILVQRCCNRLIRSQVNSDWLWNRRIRSQINSDWLWNRLINSDWAQAGLHMKGTVVKKQTFKCSPEEYLSASRHVENQLLARRKNSFFENAFLMMTLKKLPKKLSSSGSSWVHATLIFIARHALSSQNRTSRITVYGREDHTSGSGLQAKKSTLG